MTLTRTSDARHQLLDRALTQVDQALAVARAKADGGGAVPEAAGKGQFGSGKPMSPEQTAARHPVRQHRGITA